MTLLLASLMVWFWAEGKVQTATDWAEVPTIGVQYITVCGETGAHGKPIRRRFSSADFYCNTSPHTEDGWDQSRWTEFEVNGAVIKVQEHLSVFLRRSGCDPASVKLGLMIPDDKWQALETEADAWQCE